MPLILGTNSIKDTGYDVANSLRFNSGSSDSLDRTISSSPTDMKKFTISVWVKRSKLGSEQAIIGQYSSSNFRAKIDFLADDRIEYIQKNDGNTTANLITTRKFRDTSAWYHIVMEYDSAQSTSSNRLKFYVNGTQETSFDTTSYPAQNLDGKLNQAGQPLDIGQDGNSSIYFGGYMTEFVFVDGQALDPTSFGEFNSDSPTIWQPIDVSELTFGDDGFYLDFENSSSLGADVSGNSNNFTVNNLTSVDQSTDTCTNNAMTINSLYYSASSYTLTNGNLSVDGNASNAWRSLYGTFGLTSGKWYWEIKIDAINSSDANNFAIGVVSSDQVDQTSSNGKFFGTAQGYAYHGKDGKKLNNDTVTANGASYGDSYTTGDIVGVFLDLDNHKLYFSKNGTVQASGDPTSGSTGTNAAFSITTGHTYFPAIANYYSAEHYSFNYGSPPFSISSGNSDPNGFGNFEYSTQNYYSCNTKNLAEFG